jgi:hypothetical protein
MEQNTSWRTQQSLKHSINYQPFFRNLKVHYFQQKSLHYFKMGYKNFMVYALRWMTKIWTRAVMGQIIQFDKRINSNEN